MRLFLAFTIWLCALNVSSAEDVTSLNGFKLWQFKNAVRFTLGEPFKTLDTEHSTLEAHRLPPDGYMVFEYLNKMPHNIYSIQVTGDVNPMSPFKGLVLGDRKDRVIAVLGAPTETNQLKDPQVSVLKYSNLNTSVEIDANGRLYSIRSSVTKEMMSETDKEHDAWSEFTEALRNKEINKIIHALRPDVEIFWNKKTLSIGKKFADFVSAPKGEFLDALIGDNNSLLKALGQSDATREIRVAENMGVGLVYKFYEGKIVKEVVFFPYGGKYRVYEIAFSDNEA